GLRFLRHLERTGALVHLVDLDPATGRDPVADWREIQRELTAYSPALARRPQILVANKADLPGPARSQQRLLAPARRPGLPFAAVSARTGQGLDRLRADLGRLLAAPVTVPVAGAIT